MSKTRNQFLGLFYGSCSCSNFESSPIKTQTARLNLSQANAPLPSYSGNNPVSRQNRDGLSPNDLPSDPNDLIGRGWREEPHWSPNTRKFLPPWVRVGEHGRGLEFDTDPGKGDHYHEIDKKGKRVKPGSGDRHGHLFPGKRPVPPDVAEPGKAGAYEDTQEENGHYSYGGKAILDGLVVTAVTALIVFALVTAFTGGLGAPIAAAAAAGIIGGVIISSRSDRQGSG